ncbi:hypothetical protein OSTOST_12772 [Ostertagia ostertagi]
MVVAWRAVSGLLLPLVPTLAVFGNALVIIAVYREKRLQTVTNMLIVSLAVSDFMVSRPKHQTVALLGRPGGAENSRDRGDSPRFIE